MISKTQARITIKAVCQWDTKRIDDTLSICKAMCLIRAENLHELLGFASFRLLVVDELPFNHQAALRYARAGAHFVRLKYSNEQACALIALHSVGELDMILAKTTSRLGVRAFDIALKEHRASDERRHVKLALSSPAAEKLRTLLRSHGMIELPETGRARYMAQAMEALIEDYQTLFDERRRRNAAQAKREIAQAHPTH